MPPRPNPVPSYRRHKPRNQAVCTVWLANGKRKDLYLGPWKSAASRAEYARIVSLVSAHGGVYPSDADDLTINEALVRYTRHVESYYRDPDGKLSTTVVKIKWVLGYLRRLYGPTQLVDFGPPELKAIRTTMIGEGRGRKSINKAAVRVRQFFRRCVEEHLAEPADSADAAKTLPRLSPGVRAVVQSLRLTGPPVRTGRPPDGGGTPGTAGSKPRARFSGHLSWPCPNTTARPRTPRVRGGLA